jgi:hypothetical protein
MGTRGLKEKTKMETDQMATDQIEEHIGLTQPDAFEETTTGESVTGKRIFADGGHGLEKEANLRSHWAGASSEAPVGSGIPSAETQHRVGVERVEEVEKEVVDETPETAVQ